MHSQRDIITMNRTKRTHVRGLNIDLLFYNIYILYFWIT